MNATAPRHTALYRHRMHHSLVALSAVAFAATLALLIAKPLPQAAAGLAADASAPALIDTAPSSPNLDPTAPAAAADSLPQAQRKRSHVRRSRQILAMPYFSFAARS